MKARFVKAGLVCVSENPDPERTEVVWKGAVQKVCWRVGAEIEHPEAYKLVRLGVCVPADRECMEAAGMTDEQMKAAQWAHERLKRGILPEDYDRFDRGELEGYRPDGTEIPGPNARPDIQSGQQSNGGVFIP